MKSLKDIQKIVTEFNVKPRPEMRSKVLDEALEAQRSRKQRSVSGTYIWRITMKDRISKFATAAAAVIIIAIMVGIEYFGGSIDGTGAAFGDILKNIEKTKTLAWKTTFVTEGQNPRITRTMVLEPHYIRVELEDGKVWILDHSQGSTLVVDPSRKIAVISSTAKTTLNIYNAFKNFQDMEGFSIEDAGQQQIDGKSAIGFQLTKEDENLQIMVWADPETKLPILIEETRKDGQSNVFLAITTEIVFDLELDESLFSLEPPEGYEKQGIDGPIERSTHLVKRLQSATNMNQILKACLNYVEKHDSEWPNALEDLVRYGVDNQTLVNPRQPERQNGYIYLKPQRRLSPSKIVLYEAYDVWERGINVGFVDGHVELIKEESDFSKRLLE